MPVWLNTRLTFDVRMHGVEEFLALRKWRPSPTDTAFSHGACSKCSFAIGGSSIIYSFAFIPARSTLSQREILFKSACKGPFWAACATSSPVILNASGPSRRTNNMVVVKRMSISLSSCMVCLHSCLEVAHIAERSYQFPTNSDQKKFTNSKTKEKDFTDSTRPGSEKQPIDASPDRSHSVRSLPPDIEQNLRLACTSVLQTRKSYPRHSHSHSQNVPASFNRNSYAQPNASQLPIREGAQSRTTVMDKPTPVAKTRSPEDRAQRSRAQSRVDALMGRPIYTEQEQEPHSGSHSPA